MVVGAGAWLVLLDVAVDVAPPHAVAINIILNSKPNTVPLIHLLFM
jgi:hypothetical protein